MNSTETINKAFTVSKLTNKIRRDIRSNIVIMNGYTLTFLGLMAAVNLNDIVGKQILNPAQERVAIGLLVPAILGGLAESINLRKVEKKAKQMIRIHDKLMERFKRTA